METHSDHVLEGMQIYYANHPELKGDAIVNCFGISENGSTVVEPIGFGKICSLTRCRKDSWTVLFATMDCCGSRWLL